MIKNEDELNEEYQLKDEEENVPENPEYQEEMSPTPAVNQSPRGMLSKFKRLLIPLGIIVAIFLVYNVLNWYSNRKSQAEERQEAEIAQKQTPITNINKPEQLPTAPQAVVTPPAPVTTPEQTATQQQLDNITKEVASIKDTLSNIDQKSATNETKIQDISQKMDTLAAAVVSIQDEMQKAREKEQAQKKATQKVIKIPIYHVRAIVPNRAWLESDDGNTVTVKVGDRIYGYGKVELISPKQGMVVTSSGAIIQYGENDS